MREHTNELSRRAFLGGTALLGAASLVAPTAAFAVTAAEKQAEADAVRTQLIGLQADLEAAEISLGIATDEQDAARAAMEAEQVKIDEATARVLEIQDQLGSRARNMYRSGSTTFLDFVMGAASFEEFTQNWEILNKVNENDSKMVEETKTLREQLQASKDEFARQEAIAAEKAAEMQRIQDEVAAKIANATVLMQSLDAEARALLEAEQAAAARAAAAEAERLAAIEEAQRPSGGGNSSGGGGGGSSSGGGGGGGSSSGGSGSSGGGGGGGTSSGGGGGPVGSYDSVVGYAMSRIGCPYIWGAEGPNSFDCSGLVRWAYLQIGVSLPHQSGSLYNRAKRRVPVSQARPGDVLWRSGHVGIACNSGGTHYVHAPTFDAYVRDTDPLSWSGFTCALQF